MKSRSHYCQVKESVQEKMLACGRQPQEVTIIAVSKTQPFEALQLIYKESARHFGESRLQEALAKIPYLPSDCKWHFIGNLQASKVTKVISNFDLIHSVDTPLLAQKIAQRSQLAQITSSILLQVNTSGEKTKSGLSAAEWEDSLDMLQGLSHLKIKGLMTMAPYTDDRPAIRLCFRRLYQLREKWRHQMKDPYIFQHLSMGMSHDYLIAIEEGATLLRIGSSIFATS